MIRISYSEYPLNSSIPNPVILLHLGLKIKSINEEAQVIVSVLRRFPVYCSLTHRRSLSSPPPPLIFPYRSILILTSSNLEENSAMCEPDSCSPSIATVGRRF
ncbi:hypothetical protein L1887_36782 [Cichorium endivia]|nr:hypothetical protein L1887_36782 [Cichorium endivia]